MRFSLKCLCGGGEYMATLVAVAAKAMATLVGYACYSGEDLRLTVSGIAASTTLIC